MPRDARAAPHLGYRDDELTRPFAGYFRPEVAPVQDHVAEVLLGGMAPTEHGYEAQDAPARMSRPGYDPVETGWTRMPSGTTFIACLTPMPGVTAGMWDWWFGWHGSDPARYKLWHPEAHRLAAWGEDRSGLPGLTDRQRYQDNVSYVDEYLGGLPQRLAIRFVDPTRFGFTDSPGTTHICARVGYSHLPVLAGWLVHQVRPTDDGAEMRSRFFLGHPEVIDVPAHAVSTPQGKLLRTPPVRTAANLVIPHLGKLLIPASLGRDLLHHCAAEMNHLAGFLPRLHEEFRGTP
ncbi:hypothetical protein BJP25_15830 [Actinokineospora bangkokensis]|uniref:DAPG hydrolase PhiG domain-containing protein n=1 Tax=Actinokineospora bangkokensis TaxID=1193682 RepID=A0A1Q9LPG2_9PSEU|nr:hypothetical protein BJP25_15830 [Actinokineospora bangkokensis]